MGPEAAAYGRLQQNGQKGGAAAVIGGGLQLCQCIHMSPSHRIQHAYCGTEQDVSRVAGCRTCTPVGTDRYCLVLLPCSGPQKYENNLKKGSLTDNTIMLWNDRWAGRAGCTGLWVLWGGVLRRGRKPADNRPQHKVLSGLCLLTHHQQACHRNRSRRDLDMRTAAQSAAQWMQGCPFQPPHHNHPRVKSQVGTT